MAQINIRIDDDIKERADILFNEMGMNMTTAFNIFVRQTLRQGKIPFEISVDPFYSENNQKALKKSLQEAKEGKFISKTLDELQDLEK